MVTLTSSQLAEVQRKYPSSIIRKVTSSQLASGEIHVLVSPAGTHIGQEKVVILKGGSIIRTFGYQSPQEVRELEYRASTHEKPGGQKAPLTTEQLTQIKGQAQREEQIRTGVATRVIGVQAGKPITRKREVDVKGSILGGATQTLGYSAIKPSESYITETTMTERQIVVQRTPKTGLALTYQIIKPTYDKINIAVGKRLATPPSPAEYIYDPIISQARGLSSLALSTRAETTIMKGLTFAEYKAEKIIADPSTSDYMRKEITKSTRLIKLGKFVTGVSVGQKEEFKAKPVTFAIVGAASYGAGRAFSVLKLAKVSTAFPKLTKTISAGLGLAFVGSTAYEAKGAANYFEAGKIVGKRVTQSIPVIVGFQSGIKSGQAIQRKKELALRRKEYAAKTKIVELSDIKQQVRVRQIPGKEIVTGSSRISAKARVYEYVPGQQIKQVGKIGKAPIYRISEGTLKPLTGRRSVNLAGQVVGYSPKELGISKTLRIPKSQELMRFAVGYKDKGLFFTESKFSILTKAGKGIKQMTPIKFFGAGTKTKAIFVGKSGTPTIINIKPIAKQFTSLTKPIKMPVGRGVRSKVATYESVVKESSLMNLESFIITKTGKPISVFGKGASRQSTLISGSIKNLFAKVNISPKGTTGTIQQVKTISLQAPGLAALKQAVSTKTMISFPKTISKSPTLLIPFIPTTKQKVTTKTKTVVKQMRISTTIPRVKTISKTAVIPKTKTKTKSLVASTQQFRDVTAIQQSFKQVAAISTKSVTKLLPKSVVGQKILNVPLLKTIATTKAIVSPKSPFVGAFKLIDVFKPISFNVGGYINLPKGAENIELGFGALRPRALTKYQPSFEAFVFGIKGQYKPGPLAGTGLDFRPITPEFSIGKMRKLIRGLRF